MTLLVGLLDGLSRSLAAVDCFRVEIMAFSLRAWRQVVGGSHMIPKGNWFLLDGLHLQLLILGVLIWGNSGYMNNEKFGLNEESILSCKLLLHLWTTLKKPYLIS